MGHLSKTDSFSSQFRHDKPEPRSFVDELLEENEMPPPIPEKCSHMYDAPAVSKVVNLREKSRSQQHICVPEKSSSIKPALPPNKPSVHTFGRESMNTSSQPVLRINSFSDRHNNFGGTGGTEGRFAVPEPSRPPRRLQRADSQERLGRAASLVNLATPSFELRKAQSSNDVSYGSGGNNPNSGSNNSGGNNSNSEMPGGMPGMMGMPGMTMMPGLAGGGMMPNDSRLAEEFVKLQQDFFKWQQQLLQNQHVLHSRVAPLASNPPQLQSVGVMRDIMSQSQPQEVGSSSGAVEMPAAAVPKGPVERVIPIKMEITTTTTVKENEVTRPNTLMPATAAAPNRLSQSMQDITSDMGQLSTNSINRRPPSNIQQQNQLPPPPRRWGEEPNVSVGAWIERPSQPVGVYHDQDYITSAPRSRSTQDLSSMPLPSSTDQQQRSGIFPTSRGIYAQPQSMHSQPQSQYMQTQPQSQYMQTQPQSQYMQSQPQQQQLHSLPPQQQQEFAQFLQQQQQQQEPDRATFWRDYDANKHQNASIKPLSVGEPQEQLEEEPTRPPRRNSRQDSPPQDGETPKPPLTYFGQEVLVQEPPHTYYYNGDGGLPQSALSKVANNASVPTRPPYPKTVESESGGPRYTSVVTLSSDKGEQAAGEPPAKDKVRSVVQLNTDQRNNVPRTAPVVRGFRQPGEEKPNQGNSFHSKIISNAIKNQQPSQPQGRSSISPPAAHEGGGFISTQNVPVPEAPTAARLVAAALSQPATVAPKAPSPSPVTQVSSARISPSRTTQSRVSPVRSPARTSPSRTSPSSGPAFGNVQLRPVPVGLRASPEPSDVTPQPPAPPPAPIPPSAPVNQMGNIPPPPPPAPPMAPPPPPPPVPAAAANGERRTASGKRIVSAKTGPELDAREELMMAIRNHAGQNTLRKTHNFSEA